MRLASLAAPRAVLAALVLGAAGLFAAGAPASAQVFNPDSFTLDNGLEVVVIENHRAPIVTHMVWYRVGAADEPVGKSGIAHFLEHLMFKGTDKLGPGEFSQIIARNGGQENAFTSWDYTAYFQSIARDRLETVMRHEADRMTNLRLSDDIVLPERDVILEERRSRTDNDPGAQLGEMVNASLFLNHPYGIPIIGWEHEIRGLATEDAIAFYRRWYAPNNAILVIAGDVTAEEVRPLAEKYYGAVPPGEVPARVRPQEPRQFAPRRVVMKSPRVRQPSLTIDYLAPSYSAGASEHAYPLQLLDEIISGGATSRLYRRLVVEQGLAAGAGSGYSAGSLDRTSFRFYVTPRPGIELEAAESALRAEIERLREEGVTAEELADAKQRLRAAAVFARDSLSGGANVLGRALATGQRVEDVESWPQRIEAVSLEEVNAATRAVLREESSVTGVLLPKPTS